MPDEYTQIVTSDDIKAPYLASTDVAKMRAFWLEWLRYEDAVMERFKQFDGKAAIQRRVLRHCIDDTTLRTMLRYRWKQGNRALEAIPDDELYAFFKTDCERVRTNVPDFNARVRRELRCNETIRNGESRALVLIEQFVRICDESGFRDYPDVEPEAARNHIINAVRPEYLQTYLRQEINFSKKRYKCWDDFVGLLIDTFGAYTRFDNYKPGTSSVAVRGVVGHLYVGGGRRRRRRRLGDDDAYERGVVGHLYRQ
ncbi:hypothetical protein SDRG_17421 [Saprolegnia diclina VS20]|uniref:Uncharacterized protein n=1 Tax=Saprolegnia diclina (strain VS20) TaxID=1156394 RepID=T0PR51_SAPDV|nr:hypothetical protein SDRG_17421 [Saprolegnia diclina VS20]EQC24686.1 hypothetical protein SDRG_17421 [Saprolegnia diclina VS20]|eukprot:XP_008621885.1 hypothetical protein SDRG_17421 [Saprolegnia diclina VS20]